MKKIIGVLGAGALVMAMFLNTNSTNATSNNLDLGSLVTLNSANAECDSGITGICRVTTAGVQDCKVTGILGEKNCR